MSSEAERIAAAKWVPMQVKIRHSLLLWASREVRRRKRAGHKHPTLAGVIDEALKALADKRAAEQEPTS